MNNQKIEKLVEGIIEVEKDVMHRKFDVQGGRGAQFARVKADADAVNSILTLVDSIAEEE